MLAVKVKSKLSETDDIVTLELVATNGNTLPPFAAGAHIDLHLPDNITRQYSLCNSPKETHRYLIGVLKNPQSRGGSLAVHNHISEGDTITISEPRNLFELNASAKRSLLFGGGIGITPILSMAETLSEQNAPFELHYCARSENSAAFISRLQTAPFSQQAFLHFDDGSEQQKLDAAHILAEPDNNTHIYVCGPEGFMEYILGTAAKQGWHESQLHKEYFSAAPAQEQESSTFELEIKSSGEIITVTEQQTAAEALEAAGYSVNLSCEMGICGACITKVLEGEPLHNDMFMNDEEHAANNQFTPCCSRAKTSRLVLDL